MIVEWSETWRQNPSRTLPRKCTATADAMKAHTTRNWGAKSRITMAEAPRKMEWLALLAGLRDQAQGSQPTSYRERPSDRTEASAERRLNRRERTETWEN